MIRRILERPFVAIAYSLLVLYLCVMPSANIPDDVNDKTAHFLAFGGLGFLWYYLGKNKLLIAALAIGYGVLIEIIQGLLPLDFHRSFDVWDMVYDAMGVVIGIFAALIFEKFFLKS